MPIDAHIAIPDDYKDSTDPDDTLALTRAYATGKVIEWVRDYQISDTIFQNIDGQHVRANGRKLFMSSAAAPAYVMGGNGQSGDRANMALTGKLWIEYVGANPTDHNGFVMRQCFDCDAEVGVRKFATGIRLDADVKGCVHNDIKVGHIYNCKTGVRVVPSGTGWCNQNTFHGGEIDHGLGFMGDYAIFAYPNSTQGNGGCNGNKWVRPSIEGIWRRAFDIAGVSNVVEDPRMEGFWRTDEETEWTWHYDPVRWGPGSDYNTLRSSWYTNRVTNLGGPNNRIEAAPGTY